MSDEDGLLNLQPDWKGAWDHSGMPEYDQKDITPFQSVTVHFASMQDREDFIRLVDQPQITPTTRYIWHPRVEKVIWSPKHVKTVKVAQNKYPIYIVSKGRWESRITARNLDALGIDYRIVVEPQERKQYASVIDPAKVLVLPFSNLGKGSIPARNWIWEHAIKSGSKWHWILDDNISGFFILNQNAKRKIKDFNPFTPVEKFTDSYKNIAISGMEYEFFALRRAKLPPYRLNTRVYSCILIRNDLPFRWRGRYNEDTDLSLNAMKAGYCTVLFNYILAKKVTTMTMKGGNTDELYKGDGRLEMARELKKAHPGLVKITHKWGRWQHHVNYRPFARRKLIPK